MKVKEQQLDKILNELFPICRSLTGNGNRKTLKIIRKIIPIKIKEYNSGERVFDWRIPDEWNINEAWIKNQDGEKIIDFNNSNIHVVGYSRPIRGKFSFKEIKNKIHYSSKVPKAIPYLTSYYKRDWGFCVTKKQYFKLKKEKGRLDIKIDSKFKKNGSMTVGEIVIKGKYKKEILVSTYICHPSLANDNLSGIVLTTYLAKKLSQRKPNFTWRFIFIPETIGAIAYCKKNYKKMKNIDTALVVTCVGGPGQFSYKQSFDENNYLNKTVESVFKSLGKKYKVIPFDIHGSDERQYSSIGFRINSVTLSKDQYYKYDYYHTSLDDLNFVKSKNILQSYRVYSKLIKTLDNNIIFKSKNPNCEVMLSKHNLYPKLGGKINPAKGKLSYLDIRLWLLFLLDGKKGIAEVSEIMKINEKELFRHCMLLQRKKIVDRLV